MTAENYVPFPPYDVWAAQSFDWEPFESIPNIKEQFASATPEIYRKALDQVRNVAAIETGAIENLYQHDRGLTITAATEVAILDTVQSLHGQQVRAYVQSQIDAYEHVLDFATGSKPVAEAWIRELHERICAPQDTYKVVTAQGESQQPLPKGKYKEQPNHVRTVADTIHYYAPPQETPIEMQRLVNELRSREPLHSRSRMQWMTEE